MAQSPLVKELGKLIGKRHELQDQIQEIAESRPIENRTGAIRRGSEKTELYHSLISSLANVTEKIVGVERKLRNKEKIVHFSNLRPGTITTNTINDILNSMPINRTPPSVASTPFLTSSLPQTVSTVLITIPSSTPPIYSSPSINIHRNPSTFHVTINHIKSTQFRKYFYYSHCTINTIK